MLQVLYYLFYESGLRVSEIVCLTFGMFYDQKGRIVRDLYIQKALCKGNCSVDRWMPLSKDTRDLLQRYFNQANEQHRFGADLFLFPGRQGPTKPFCSSTASRHLARIFKTALGTCDLLRSHTPRRTLATDLYHQTKDILLVRDALGHRQVETSFRYIESDLRRVKRAKCERLSRQRAYQKGYRPKRRWETIPARREVQDEFDLGVAPGAPSAVPHLNSVELELARAQAELAALRRRQELKQLGAVRRFNLTLPKGRPRRRRPKGVDWPPGNSE